MYYHEFISQIAKAMAERDDETVDQLRHKAFNYLLSEEELAAIDALAEAALELIGESHG